MRKTHLPVTSVLVLCGFHFQCDFLLNGIPQTDAFFKCEYRNFFNLFPFCRVAAAEFVNHFQSLWAVIVGIKFYMPFEIIDQFVEIGFREIGFEVFQDFGKH